LLILRRSCLGGKGAILEGEIKRIEQAIASYRPLKLDDAMNGLREHITKELLGFKEALLAAGNDTHLVQAKTALAKHVGKLVLTPATRDGRPVYKVTASVTVPGDGGDEKCRKQLVARDGIPLLATLLCIPFEEFYIDPKLTLVQTANRPYSSI
jgi:hypothetical protein